MSEWLLSGAGIVAFAAVAWLARWLGETLASPHRMQRLRFWERGARTSKATREQLARIASLPGEVVPMVRTTHRTEERPRRATSNPPPAPEGTEDSAPSAGG